MNILDKIVAYKKEEILSKKKAMSVERITQSNLYESVCNSMVNSLKATNASGIIAEFKRKSPSKSNINLKASVPEVTQAYVEAGASGLSILTDEHFFGGSLNDLQKAKAKNKAPILRKDFIIDAYQIHEAKSNGADVILLIAEILSKSQLNELAEEAKSLGLEILMEIHSEQQLEKYCSHVDIIGVNNRNLETFEVNIQNSINLYNSIPDEVVKISESGISKVESILKLKEFGFKGFLIGEHFMTSSDPGEKCKKFINEISTYRINNIVNP